MDQFPITTLAKAKQQSNNSDNNKWSQNDVTKHAKVDTIKIEDIEKKVEL